MRLNAHARLCRVPVPRIQTPRAACPYVWRHLQIPLGYAGGQFPVAVAQISYWGILIFWQIPQLCQLGVYHSYVEQITNEITVSKYKPA